MEESTPELAATRYRRVIEGYKSRLRTNPDLKMSEYCKESHTNYRGVIDWTKRHGISILELRREARGETSGSTSAPQSDGAFIQFMPLSWNTSGNLHGISITFPDGVNLTLQESSTRYFMCQHPVSMRKGIDSLFNLVVSESPMSPMTGDVFVFFSKNRQSVNLLRWDTDGFLLYQKRLERGSFEMPRKNADTGYYELSWETFSFIMSGVSLESVCFRKRYRTRFMSI